MVSVNIAIKKEAYDFLMKQKREGKSFSDVILEFKKDKQPLDFFGILKEKDWKAAEKQMKSFRESFKQKICGK